VQATGARHDAVIIGGGHNGLVAAGYLARAGLSVLVLERRAVAGGAVAGERTFTGVDARLSRYSYLVSLLPDQIVTDLGLRLGIRSRQTASYVPFDRDGELGGLFVERCPGAATAGSFAQLTGSDVEYVAWQRLSATIGEVAQAVAPTLLRPLPTRADLEDLVRPAASSSAWEGIFERPLGELIEASLGTDEVRGMVFTDALVGTHTYAHDPSLLQNRVFLYHVIGNGTGEWRVPVGGMGAVATAMERSAREAGAQILTRAEVVEVAADDDAAEVTWVDEHGAQHTAGARYLLSNVSPHTLAGLRGRTGVAQEEGCELKINMVVRRLPRLRSGFDPRLAFAGTFHIDQTYSQLEAAYRSTDAGVMPDRLPFEIYCHSLTDPSILGPELAQAGWHTLTLFGHHAPARLFARDNSAQRDLAVSRALAGLNRYLDDPIEDCLAQDADGAPCLEAMTPLDLEERLGLPGGHIFHGDMEWPFLDEAGDDRWGVATDAGRLLMCGSGSRRGGAVSGIGGHNAAHAVLERIGGRA
jgi:phytoene dehydrogenase-like protein